MSQSPVYLVFGASGGIGQALSRRLAKKGARLTLAARGEERLASLAAELDARHFALDALNSDSVETAVQQTAEHFGGIDGVVNLVGSILLKPAHATNDEEFRETLDLNLLTAFHVLRSGVKAMRKKGGSVVLMSSAAAAIGLVNHEAVAAAKAGVEGLARSAAATYARFGIRVNVVAPGLVDTPLAARITSNPAALEASQAMHPLGRIGRPDDVASAIAWALDPEQSWVTGQTIGVDGGLSRVRSR